MMGRQTDGLRRLTAHNLPYNSLSTVWGQTGILVHVHPVLPWNLKSQQPQLPQSEPDGQPTESSSSRALFANSTYVARRSETISFVTGAASFRPATFIVISTATPISAPAEGKRGYTLLSHSVDDST
jgi:hypothetical protein